MIIDLILDRKDGAFYNPHDFYMEVASYGYLTPVHSERITRAMDGGEEDDVRRELINYIHQNGYNEDLKDYIESVKWLEKDKAYIYILDKENGRILGRDVTDMVHTAGLSMMAGMDMEGKDYLLTDKKLDVEWVEDKTRFTLYVIGDEGKETIEKLEKGSAAEIKRRYLNKRINIGTDEGRFVYVYQIKIGDVYYE